MAPSPTPIRASGSSIRSSSSRYSGKSRASTFSANKSQLSEVSETFITIASCHFLFLDLLKGEDLHLLSNFFFEFIRRIVALMFD